MPRVRRTTAKNQSPTTQALQQPIPLDDGTVTTPAALAMIRALIPLGLRAVEEALLAEVATLAGPRYARDDDRPAVVRWGAQRGSVYVADQKLPITVPRVRDRDAQCEVPLATYAALQTRRAHDVGLFRKVLGGLAYFGEADHSFRTKAIRRFGPSRSVISVQGDHAFRSMPITT